MKKINLCGLLGFILFAIAGCGAADSVTSAASGDYCVFTYTSSKCGAVYSCSTQSGNGYYKANNGTRYYCSGSNCSSAASSMLSACP